jgi:predicted GIY-YIG superfamily endonuclease
MTTKIYVLELVDQCWYVGKTVDTERRLTEHLMGVGASWTALHRPQSVAEVREMTTPYDEDNVTKEYMRKYGIEYVRGGAYSTVKLPRGQQSSLIRELRSAGDECLRCGKRGHFQNDCHAILLPSTPYAGVSKKAPHKMAIEAEPDPKVRRHKRRVGPGSGKCGRCGRTGCFTSRCEYAKDVNGVVITAPIHRYAIK